MNENDPRNYPNANLNPPINNERCNFINYFPFLLRILILLNE